MRASPAAAAGVACALLVAAALALLLLGPAYSGAGAACSSQGGCHTYASASSLPWTPVLAIPVAGAAAVLLGTLVGVRSHLGRHITAAGAIVLAGFTVVAMASVGMLFLPADVAAALGFAHLVRHPGTF